MTVRIELSPQDEARLREQATSRGRDVPAYVAELIQRAIRQPSVDELLAPFRREVAESGMSDDELDAFFEKARDEVHQQKHGG